VEIDFGGRAAAPHAGERPLPEYGTLRCACHRYPIVDGIPVLQQRDGLERIVDRIADGDRENALLEALNLFRVTWARRSRLHQLVYRRACRRLVADGQMSFEEAVTLVRQPKGFGDYLFHRWANTSFLGGAGVISALATLARPDAGATAVQVSSGVESKGFAAAARMQTPLTVLDLACGAGHSSFLMRRLFPSLTVVSADHDFVSLYLAKRYFGPEGVYVCMDAEVPVPFPDAIFQAVFCLDAFHYFRSKRTVVSELRRVVRSGGLWLFPHLHNALQENITPGFPLPPDKYLEMFEFASPRLYDEMMLLDGLVRRGTLDLGTATQPDAVRRANALSLLGGGAALWGVHEGPFEPLARRPSGLAFNPIYARTANAGDIRLELRWPNRVMEQECKSVEAILPHAVDVSRAELRELEGDTPLVPGSTVRRLLTRFVVVPLPSHYCRRSAGRDTPVQ
jgi:SAM-dependent methyltransferase